MKMRGRTVKVEQIWTWATSTFRSLTWVVEILTVMVLTLMKRMMTVTRKMRLWMKYPARSMKKQLLHLLLVNMRQKLDVSRQMRFYCFLNFISAPSFTLFLLSS